MLPTVWQALAQRTRLTSLSVKFPSKRYPRPVTVVPPMTNLKSLKITDIDPLCYADDISYLLLGSKNLRHLTLHWSPRMRRICEPSTHLVTYFGKCEAAKYALPLKSLALQNLFTYDCGSFAEHIDNDTIEEATFLNSAAGLNDSGSAAFLDTDWRDATTQIMPKLKMLRVDKISRAQCNFIGMLRGLERLYLIGPRSKSSTLINDKSRENTSSAVQTPPTSDTSSPGIMSSSTDTSNNSSSSLRSLQADFIDTIIRCHGPTLRHLLLIPQWHLKADDISLIIRHCPNLEQLGIGTEFANFKHLRLLIPFLPKLVALRFLGDGEGPGTFLETMRDLDNRGIHEEKIAIETVNREWSKLRYMELGARDIMFEVGGRYLVERTEDMERIGDEADKEVWKREVRRLGMDEVGEIDIWKMDSMVI